jgi:hypothetical protein
MDNPPPFDRSIIPPALIGIFSVLGICLVLMISRYNASRAVAPVTATETPFKYIYLGTEPAISTESVPEESATATLSDGEPQPSPRPTRATLGTPILLTPLTPGATTSAPLASAIASSSPTGTPTSASAPPLNPATYDDIDSGLDYSGNWSKQTNISGAYQGTLHVSGVAGNSVTFRFIGRQVRLIYQPAPFLGIVRIILDNKQPIDLNQSDTSTHEWVSASLVNETHTITITHLSGGSVNLDYVVIPNLVLTPTSTVTRTPTP